MKILFVLMALVVLAIPVFGQDEEPEVLTNADLGWTHKKTIEVSMPSNSHRFVGTYPTYGSEGELSAVESENTKRAEALDRINRLENERAQENIEKGNRMKTTPWMESRDAQQRKERQIQRDTELDRAYRDAGLSNEREMQKNRENEEKRASSNVSRFTGSNRGAINSKTGEYYPPSAGGIINPRTGEFYPETAGGYINPRTGEFMPKQ